MIDLDALLARLKMVMDTHPDDGGQVLLADGVEDCYEAITRLRAELAQRTAERNAAQRLYLQARIPDGRPEQLAQTLGWDCFDAPHATDGRVQNGGAA
jgi:hypothetical protein